MARARTLYVFLFALCFSLALLTAPPAARCDASLGFAVTHAFSIPPDPVTNPTGTLAVGADGFLYGLAYNAGGGSAFFKVRPDGTGLILLHKYQSSNDNVFPAGTLTLGRDGFFYGMSYGYGANNTGALCKVSADGSVSQTFYTFSAQPDNTMITSPNSDGAFPFGSLTQGNDGALYGTTMGGGPGGRGTLFKIGTDGTGFTVLHAFSAALGPHRSNADGATPNGALVFAPDGFLYGTTAYGGMDGRGTIFRIASDGTVFQPLHAFNNSDGALPAAGLILGRDGFLYGTTYSGGANVSGKGGTVFRIQADGTGFQVLHTFRDPNIQPPTSEGAGPQAALVQGQDGTLYGVTENGGINNAGTIFRINPDSIGYQSLHSFDSAGPGNTDGVNPLRALVQGADGSFYGTSQDGGTNNYGTLFRLTPATGHTHLLWNNTDARVMLWSVAQDGSFTLNGFGPYTDGAPQNVWHATAVATGADGVSHLLWNNTDGRVMLWTVDDAGNFTLAGYGPYTDNAPQNKWSAVGVSVGPDNVVHLLWSNTDHRAMLWNVASDFTFTLAGFGPYTDNAPNNLWTATALATGPDGVSHILWNNTDYRVMLWNVAPDFSFTLAGYGPYTDGAAQHLWSAVGVSVGPDNQTHLLWSNTDRRAMFWNVDSAFGFTLAGYGPYTDDAPQNLWTATALATGPDGLSHLLWGNTDDRAMLWGVNDAFGFTVAGYGPYTDNAPGNLWTATAVSAGP